MENRDIARQLQKLEDLIARSQRASGDDLELLSHWAKYLCILSAGLIENALTQVYGDFVGRAASEPVANFARATLSKIQNPKTARYIEVARSFKPAWEADLTSFVDENGRRDAIDSIMANRHLIAHGKDSGVTLVRVRDWLQRAVEVIDFVEKQTRT
jgi:hypothetical protein